MDGEQKFFLFSFIVGAILIAALGTGGFIYSNKAGIRQAQGMQVCLQVGKAPLECKEALK